MSETTAMKFNFRIMYIVGKDLTLTKGRNEDKEIGMTFYLCYAGCKQLNMACEINRMGEFGTC